MSCSIFAATHVGRWGDEIELLKNYFFLKSKVTRLDSPIARYFAFCSGDAFLFSSAFMLGSKRQTLSLSCGSSLGFLLIAVSPTNSNPAAAIVLISLERFK